MGFTLGLPWLGRLSDFPIVQPFGGTFSGEPPGHGQAHFHQGVDFACPQGTPLIATADGTVRVAGQNTNTLGLWGYGVNILVIDHGNGFLSLYGHMSQLNVSAGQGVVKGQSVGLSGGAHPGNNAEGNTTGPHLHLTLYQGLYNYVDPLPYFEDHSAAAAAGYSPGAASNTVGYAQAIVWARQAGIPEGQLAVAAAIAMAESGLTLNATHQNADGSTDYGLWQINSVHCQGPGGYAPTHLLADGAYNARAMYDISNHGRDWRPWSTYTSGAYLQYLPAAQAALASTPPGTQVPLPRAGDAGATEPPAIVVPNLPVNTVAIAPVRVNAAGLVSVDNAEAVAFLHVRAGFVPVTEMEVTAANFLTPGSFTARTDLGWLDLSGATGVIDNILEPTPTQVTLFMGYVPDATQPYAPEQLVPVFTGLLDEPEFTHDGPQDTLEMSGPDLSAILSEPSATPHSLDQYQNMTSDAVVRQLVTAHNPRGTNGLSVQATATPTLAGSVFNDQQIESGQPGTTEWDLVTRLAQNEGFVTFFNGTTLYWGPLPPEGPPLVLDFGLDQVGRPVSNVRSVTIKPNKHSKRDYNIVVTSYQQKTGQTLTVTTGNPQSRDTLTFPQPTNTPQSTLEKRARALLAEYAATEIVCTITIEGFIRVTPGQPLAINSARLVPQFRYPYKKFYPVKTVYRYDKSNGFSMTITCASHAWAMQAADAAQRGVF